MASGEGWGVALDGKPLRTPGRRPLAVPTRALAEAIAAEWNAQGDRIDPRSMRLTGLANAAIDRIAIDPARYVADLARYGETDLLCYRAEGPEGLCARQCAAWDPLLDWAREALGVEFTLAAGVVHRPQPEATLARQRHEVAALDPFRLAALTTIVTISGSLVAGLALLAAAFDEAAVWRASRIDEDWQAEKWGEDSEARDMAEARCEEFGQAARMLRLLEG